MPKEKVTDLVTDREIAFARLILAGEMSDQQAAEAAGLSPSSAAYTKAKPRVQAWMQQHRAALDKLILEEEAELLRRRSATRERVLERLWAVADLTPDQTRNNMASQMKALAMIVAMENLIPDRRATAPQKPTAPIATARIFQSDWLREREAGASSHSNTEDDPPQTSTTASDLNDPHPAPDPAPAEPIAQRAVTFAEANSSPYTSFVPDTRDSFQLPKRAFTRWRR